MEGVSTGFDTGDEDIRPSPELCREALDRLLRDPRFTATERDRKFLAFVVGEALAGRADRIKAYSVAVEVFGRDASFDPQTDPIVRVQAGHLRRALDRYYLGPGQDEPVVISIPKGRYAPDFALRPAAPSSEPTPEPPAATSPPAPPPRARPSLRLFALAAPTIALLALLSGAWLLLRPAARAPAATPDIPRVLVQPFESSGGDAQSAQIARGLTHEVVSQLAKFKDLVVLEPDARSGAGPSAGAAAGRYALAGAVELAGESLRLQVRLVDQKDGGILWANSYDTDLGAAGLLKVESELAGKVASVIAQPYGVIFHADLSRRVETPPDDWEAYSCTLRYYAYRVSLDPAQFPPLRQCLERAVERFPQYATAWALLSQTYVDELRFGYRTGAASPPATIDQALAAARRAVELDPQNVRGLQAEMFSLYFKREIGAALRVGEEALALNPNDTELMGEYGYRLALSGDWERGCALLERAHERNPNPAAYYETALALCAYMRKDYEAASTWIRKTPVPANPNYHIIAAVILAETGSTADVEAERRWLMENAGGLLKDPRQWIAARVVRREDVDRLAASLKKAGIPFPD